MSVQYGSGSTSIVSVGCVVDHPGEDVDEEQEDGDQEGGPGGAYNCQLYNVSVIR